VADRSVGKHPVFHLTGRIVALMVRCNALGYFQLIQTFAAALRIYSTLDVRPPLHRRLKECGVSLEWGGSGVVRGDSPPTRTE
jgi:hypothetical protein